jgi:hypothetical protein
MLLGVLSVLKQIKKGKPIVDIAYKRLSGQREIKWHRN